MSLPQVLCICAEELSESEKGKKTDLEWFFSLPLF